MGMSLIATTPTPCTRLGARRTHTSDTSDRNKPSRSCSSASSHVSRASPSAPEAAHARRAGAGGARYTSSTHAGARHVAVTRSASTASGHRRRRKPDAAAPAPPRASFRHPAPQRGTYAASLYALSRVPPDLLVPAKSSACGGRTAPSSGPHARAGLRAARHPDGDSWRAACSVLPWRRSPTGLRLCRRSDALAGRLRPPKDGPAPSPSGRPAAAGPGAAACHRAAM